MIGFVIVCCLGVVSGVSLYREGVFTPAPLGGRPPCATKGKTFCENVDKYPTKIIQKLLNSKFTSLDDFFTDESEGLDEPPEYLLQEDLIPESVAKGSGKGTLASDAVAKGSSRGTLASDEVAKGSSRGTLASDAVAKGSSRGTMVSDAVAKGSSRGTMVSDAVAKGSSRGTMVSDAVAKGSSRGTMVSDEVARGSGKGTLASDAVAKGSRKGRSVRGGGSPSGQELEEECPVQRKEVRPQLAKNSEGEWRFIVQDDSNNQTVEVQLCDQKEDCRDYCTQFHSRVPLVSVDPTGKFHKESFWLPSICICHPQLMDDILS